MRILLHVIPAACAALLVLACSSASNQKSMSTAEICRARLDEAKKDMGKGKNAAAREEINRMMGECSGTGFMEEAEYLLAETYFLDEDWEEARGEYDAYVRHYPSTPFTESAAYKKGLAGYNIPYVLGRDQKSTQQALEDFGTFVSTYVRSAKIDSANYYIDRLNDRVAERDYYVARLYFRMEEYQAAALSLADFLRAHPRAQLVGVAREQLVQSYLKLGQIDQAERMVELFAADTVAPLDPKKGGEFAEKIARERTKQQKRIEKEQKRQRKLEAQAE